MKKYYFLIIFLLSSFAFATSMNEAFNQGRDVGKGNNGNAQQIMKDFQPNQIQGFQAHPQESQYYTGVKGGNPNLMAIGMNALENSESGKAIKDSIINNPKVKISQESDFIRSSNNIRNNAELISGIKGGQCVAKVLNKTTFSSHYCEKDNTVKQVCTNTAKVKWVGEKTFVQKEIDLGRIKFDNLLKFKFTAPYDGIITDYELVFYFAPRGASVGFSISGINLNLVKSIGRGWQGGFKRYFNSYDHYYQSNAPIEVKQSQVVQGDMIIHSWSGLNGNDPNRVGGFISYIMNNNDLSQTYATLKIKMNVGEDTTKPEIEWENICAVDTDNAIQMSEQCTEKGETRKFERNGKIYELHSECWQKATEYLVSDASDNECRAYDNNKSCTVSERECIAQNGEYCSRFRVKYQCSKTTSTNGVVCGDKFFCSDGSCADLESNINSDFGHAVSQLATLAQAGKDVGLDPKHLKAFSGKPMFCRKSGFGFSDCCKDSGWGHKVGLAKCNSEENTLGQAKEKKLVVYVGTYCSKKVLGKCIRRKSGYCVFDNKLARIIQYQGRSGQLGIGFGGAKNPDCRGITVDELQRIDFNAMDYSDFYDELNERTNLPDRQQLMDHMKNSIIDQLQKQQ